METSLFEHTEETIKEKAPEIEAAVREALYDPLDDVVKAMLQKVTLYDLVSETEKHKADHNLMFFI